MPSNFKPRNLAVPFRVASGTRLGDFQYERAGHVTREAIRGLKRYIAHEGINIIALRHKRINQVSIAARVLVGHQGSALTFQCGVVWQFNIEWFQITCLAIVPATTR